MFDRFLNMPLRKMRKIHSNCTHMDDDSDFDYGSKK